MGTRERTRRTSGEVSNGSAGARVELTTLSGLPDLVRSFGIPSESVLGPFGLTDADLQEPGRTGSSRDLSRLLDECAQMTHCPHFGLLLSRSADLLSLGMVGRLAQHSPTVGAAIEGLGTYFALHDSGGTVDVFVKGEEATLRYTLHAAGLAAPEQIHDFVAGVMINVMRGLCGADWRPTLVMLSRKRPKKITPYRELLGNWLKFDAIRTAVVFPRRWLARPVPGADPLLYRLLLREVCDSIGKPGALIRSDARRAIVRLLHAGRASRREVARALGLHERTLSRCLQLCGTTFQELLDEVRSEAAQQLLRETQVPIAQIARELGFMNSTVMARAFRRWNGMSPRDYRSQHR